MVKKNEVGDKIQDTALKLLDCAAKAAERSAAKSHTGDLQHVQGVVDSAIKLLDLHDRCYKL